jgi:hypothetical protein
MLWAAKVNSRRVGRISRIPEVRSVRNEDFLRDTLARKPHAKYRGVNQIIFLTRHTFGMRVFSIYSPLRCALRQARDRRDDLEWGWADAVKCVAGGSSPGVAARVSRTGFHEHDRGRAGIVPRSRAGVVLRRRVGGALRRRADAAPCHRACRRGSHGCVGACRLHGLDLLHRLVLTIRLHAKNATACGCELGEHIARTWKRYLIKRREPLVRQNRTKH